MEGTKREMFQCFGRESPPACAGGGGQLSAAAAVTGYSGLSLNDGSPQCWIAARPERRLRSEKRRAEETALVGAVLSVHGSKPVFGARAPPYVTPPQSSGSGLPASVLARTYTWRSDFGGTGSESHETRKAESRTTRRVGVGGSPDNTCTGI